MGVRTKTSRKSPISARALSRMRLYGEMNAVSTTTPFRVSSLATKVTRSMFLSRSSFEKPRSRVRLCRTTSPSRRSEWMWRSCNSSCTRVATVVLPEPERPVNQTVTPFDISFSEGSGGVRCVNVTGWGVLAWPLAPYAGIAPSPVRTGAWTCGRNPATGLTATCGKVNAIQLPRGFVTRNRF